MAPEHTSIRPAVLDDMAALAEVFRRSSLSNEGDRPFLLAHPHVLELPDASVREGRTLVAEAGGRVVGFVTTVEAGGDMELEDLFVDPDWMGRGIGRRLVEAVIDRGDGRLVVTANDHAAGFYERLGFVAEATVATRFRPGVRMRRPGGRTTGSAGRPGGGARSRGGGGDGSG